MHTHISIKRLIGFKELAHTWLWNLSESKICWVDQQAGDPRRVIDPVQRQSAGRTTSCLGKSVFYYKDLELIR